MRSLVWFRTDLRVADHTALHAAATASTRGLVGVFAVCGKQWLDHDLAPARVDFVRRTLAVLSGDLEDLRIALRIVEAGDFDAVPEALLAVAREHDCDGLYFNAAYEVNEGRRDAAVREAFEGDGRSVHVHHDQCLARPGSVLTGSDSSYKVFTPFKKNLLGRFRDEGRPEVWPAPEPRDAMVGAPDPVPAAGGFGGYEEPDDAIIALWPAGESEAGKRLDRFIDERAESYDATRDLAAEDATSRLSPYLSTGAISVRTCFEAAAKANGGRLLDGNDGLATWISELVWRDFYRHVMDAWPRVSMHRPFKLETESLTWRDDEDGFAAWCDGRTGYPIVDAGMRQLKAEGWMHNRLRMIVAMFLTKDLLVDWRRGERWFMQHLIDGDLASNNGGWQWSASTGTDAQPYFRVFNPVTQGERFDADGTYIRRFVPELADLREKAVHAPWKSKASLIDSSAYPKPIVEHSMARDRAIALFKS